MTDFIRIYVDTSFYFDLITDDAVGRKAEPLIKGKLLCSSSLLLLEAERNLVRLGRENKLNVDDFSLCRQKLIEDSEALVLKDLTIDLCLTGFYPATQTPRSGDLVHLRTAIWFKQNGGLESFITSDYQQKLAADELGLPAVYFGKK